MAASWGDGATALMTFEGLKEGEQVLNFYNGGHGSMGGGPGPKFGVAFTSTAVALTHGNYGEEPSPPTVMTHRSKPGHRSDRLDDVEHPRRIHTGPVT